MTISKSDLEQIAKVKEEFRQAKAALESGFTTFARIAPRYFAAMTLEIDDESAAEYLSGIVSSRTSRWSGGHSVTNAIEQIEREAAAELLRNRIRKWSYRP